MATGMQAIEPQHAKLVPPLGSVPAGQTPEGIPLYRLTQMRSKSVPMLDKYGKQIWMLHPQNNMPLYPRREPKIYEHTELFTMESDGQFNVNKVPYAFPTEEEIAAEKRAAAVAAMKDSLAGALVDADMTAAEFVQVAQERLAEPVEAAATPEDSEEIPEPEQPPETATSEYEF